jgi:hypothetical protein
MLGHAPKPADGVTMRRMTAYSILWLLYALLASGAAQAFGAEGHRVTGFIAEAELDAVTRAELVEILGSVDLAQLALVADERRDEFRERYAESPRWHYDDRLVCHPDLPPSDYCPDGACASAAIRRFRDALADRRAPREDRALAVLFLVHIVGDIHQPLHAADNNDRGGNAVRVALPDEAGTRNLHAAWDVDFVRRALAGRTPRAAADAWRVRYSGERRRWRGGTVEAWMQESYARAVDLSYGQLPVWDCDRAAGGVVTLSVRYTAAAIELTPLLLTEAGVRIAAVLQEALAVARQAP